MKWHWLRDISILLDPILGDMQDLSGIRETFFLIGLSNYVGEITMINLINTRLA